MAEIKFDAEGKPYFEVGNDETLKKYDLDGKGTVTQADLQSAVNALNETPVGGSSFINNAMLAFNAAQAAVGNPSGFVGVVGSLGMKDGEDTQQQYKSRVEEIQALFKPYYDSLDKNGQPTKKTAELALQGVVEQPGAVAPLTGNPAIDARVAEIQATKKLEDRPKNPLIGLDDLYDTDSLVTKIDAEGNTIYYVPGNNGKGKNIARYKKGDDLKALQQMSNAELTQLRKQAYYAGYYGESGPSSYVGPPVKEDLDLMNAIMEDANISGHEYTDTLSQRAERGMRYGAPLDEEDISKLANDSQQQIVDYAAANGLKLSDKFIRNQVKNIADGTHTVEETLKFLRDNHTKVLYPAFSEEIDKGLNMMDIAEPYITAAANTLELDPNAVDINDPAVRKMMQATGPDGKPVRKSMWEFEEDLKKDDRWQYTDNAWQSIGSASMQVMRMMGMEG